MENSDNIINQLVVSQIIQKAETDIGRKKTASQHKITKKDLNELKSFIK